MKKSIIKSALCLVLSAVMLTPSVSFADTDKNLAYAEFFDPRRNGGQYESRYGERQC